MKNTTDRERILVVDDSPETLEMLERNLNSVGYQVFKAPGVAEAIKMLDDTVVDLVITDYKMPRSSGMDLIRYVRENLRNTEVMMITGYATVEGAVEAIKTGAEQYLTKPFTDVELFSAVRSALDKRRLRMASLDRHPQTIRSQYGILGESEPMNEVFSAIAKAASTPATVLITGQSGTGKELVARAVHYSSKRSSAPLVPVNCGGIPEGLLESELFGYVKGAFTGALESRAGFFQTADGGSIFLDEVSETSLAMQVKLLRVPDDIILLARHFARKYSEEAGKPEPRFSDRAFEILRNYAWPGNVRELENVVQSLVVMTDSDVIDVPDLPDLMRYAGVREKGLDRKLDEVEAEHVRNVLASVRGNKTRAAEILGIDRKTLREKMRRLQKDPD
jgi:DNA-binding NtrC family response regulator